MNPSILEFVHEALLREVSRGDIAEALGKGGWSAKEIQDALDAFVVTGLSLPVPRKRVSTSPKEAFFFLMLFTSLYTAAFGFGAVLFKLIELWFPLAGELAFSVIPSLRFSLASVVVAFPVFLLMCWLVARETARNPGQKISPIRRWLTYLTLFLASATLISDLIAMLVAFLNGDLTLRFILKAAVVAALAGGIFLYYLRDLRQDEEAPAEMPTRTTPLAKLALSGLITCVVVVLSIGFAFVGSPARARLTAQDQQREQDLAGIYWGVERYYTLNGKLPVPLSACDANPETFIKQKHDPATGAPYLYRVVDDKHFELGATFTLPTAQDPTSRNRPFEPNESGFWKHSAGPQVFRIELRDKKFIDPAAGIPPASSDPEGRGKSFRDVQERQ